MWDAVKWSEEGYGEMESVRTLVAPDDCIELVLHTGLGFGKAGSGHNHNANCWCSLYRTSHAHEYRGQG